MTADLVLRGRTLTFLRWPDSATDLAALRYEEDGGLLLRDGRIAAAGPYAEVQRQAGEGAKIVDHRPHLLLPGFIDCHAHMPQMQVIASYGAELLDWLNKYTFPEETKFRDAQHGRRIARLFLDEMVRHGTTSVVAYCSVHKGSIRLEPWLRADRNAASAALRLLGNTAFPSIFNALGRRLPFLPVSVRPTA